MESSFKRILKAIGWPLFGFTFAIVFGCFILLIEPSMFARYGSVLCALSSVIAGGLILVVQSQQYAALLVIWFEALVALLMILTFVVFIAVQKVYLAPLYALIEGIIPILLIPIFFQRRYLRILNSLPEEGMPIEEGDRRLLEAYWLGIACWGLALDVFEHFHKGH